MLRRLKAKSTKILAPWIRKDANTKKALKGSDLGGKFSS